MKSFSPFLICFLALLAAPSLHAQGIVDGFMKGPGNFDLALSFSHEKYSDFYVGDMEISEPALGDITTQSTSLYAAFGLAKRLDAVVNLPYISAKASKNSPLDQSSFQDLSLYLKGSLVDASLGNSKLKLLAAGGVSLPLNEYVADAPVAVGHRAKSFDGRLIAQFEPVQGGFIAVQGGYIWRSKVDLDGTEVEVPSALDLILRAGFGAEKFYGDVWAQMQNSEDGTDIGGGPFPTNAVSFFRVGGNAYVPLVSGLGIGAGVGYTVSGENVGKALRFSGSLVYKFSK